MRTTRLLPPAAYPLAARRAASARLPLQLLACLLSRLTVWFKQCICHFITLKKSASLSFYLEVPSAPPAP